MVRKAGQMREMWSVIPALQWDSAKLLIGIVELALSRPQPNLQPIARGKTTTKLKEVVISIYRIIINDLNFRDLTRGTQNGFNPSKHYPIQPEWSTIYLAS